MNWKEIAKKILGYFFPEFSNKVTWTILLFAFSLLSSTFLTDIARAVISENLELNITDGKDSLYGFWLVVVALVHNLGSKIIESKREKIRVIDLAQNISQVRSLIDGVDDFDEIKKSSWWGFIEANLTDWEKNYITPPAISNSFGVDPTQLSGDARKKQIVSQMLARLEHD